MSRIFNESLQRLIDEEKITLSELSRRTGVPYTTINGWLKENRDPTLDNVIKVADYFNCTIDHLAGRKEY